MSSFYQFFFFFTPDIIDETLEENKNQQHPQKFSP